MLNSWCNATLAPGDATGEPFVTRNPMSEIAWHRDASFRRCPVQRHMAGEAIGSEIGMGGSERTRTDHEVGVVEDERAQPKQIGR